MTRADDLPFKAPDLGRPLDTKKRLDGCPSDATVKGVFLRSIVERAARAGVQLENADSRYVAFKSYPLREYIQLLATTAESWPRETLKELGSLVFPAMKSSLVGKVFFSMFGSSAEEGASALRVIARAYKLMTNHARAELLSIDDQEGNAVVRLEDVWSFPDCYHLGILEGAGRAYNPSVTCLVRERSLSSVDIRLEWVPLARSKPR
jgi:uncharacterized protein (TIGR02265 family)